MSQTVTYLVRSKYARKHGSIGSFGPVMASYLAVSAAHAEAKFRAQYEAHDVSARKRDS